MSKVRKLFISIIVGAVAVVLGVVQADAQVKSSTISIGTNCTASVISITITNNMSDISNALAGVDVQSIVKAFAGSSNKMSFSISTNIHSFVTTIGGTNSCAVSCSAGGTAGNLQQLLSNIMVSVSARAGSSGAVDAVTGPVTWFGVATEKASADLHAQLPLPEDAGLVVRNVSKDSPAEKAGVQLRDILVKVDYQLLVTEDQLRTLVRSRKDGDEITLTVLRKGKELELKARLIEKQLAPGEIAGAQVVDLGSFSLDLGKIVGQLGTNIHPIVINRVFSGSGDTNIQKVIDDALKEAMTQLKQQQPIQLK